MPTHYKLFKGSRSEYVKLHYWVKKQLGKPQMCENCGIEDGKRYEWANISGLYMKDITDWARLCSRCHRLIDNTGNFEYTSGKDHHSWRGNYCRKGHLLEGDNLRFSKSKNTHTGKIYDVRVCITCWKAYMTAYKAKKKAEAKP